MQVGRRRGLRKPYGCQCGKKGDIVNKTEKKRLGFGRKPRGCEYAGSQVKEKKKLTVS